MRIFRLADSWGALCVWLVTASVLLAVLGCVTTSQEPEETYTPTFDYAPPSQATPRSAKVAFIVVGAQVVGPPVDIFQQFAANLPADFQEMLLARGFSVRGPFPTYDEVTYPDKKNSDLVLMPRMTFTVDTSGLRWSEDVASTIFLASKGAAYYKPHGNLTLSGHLDLIVSESLSNEKMWSKSVSIPAVTIPINSGSASYPSKSVPLQILLEHENGLRSELARKLDQIYKETLSRAWSYLDPEEMRGVKKESLQIRERKVY